MRWFVLRLLPKNALSVFIGWLSRLRWPSGMLRPVIKIYALAYNVNLSEMLEPIDSYRTFDEFFTRRLKPESRPIEAGLVSPADGTITEFGEIAKGQLLQAKGISYSLGTLVGDDTVGKRFDGGFYFTIYLSPRDCHRVISPLDSEVAHLIHVEGDLWPVNSWSTKAVPGLFVGNERLVVLLNSKVGSVAVVFVGATNVGSIATPFGKLRTNTRERLLSGHKGIFKEELHPPRPIAKGGELGEFHLGSTLVVLFEAGRFRPGMNLKRGSVRYGQSLGEI